MNIRILHDYVCYILFNCPTSSSYRIHTHAICYASANAVRISLQHRCTLQGPWLCTFAPKEDIVGDEPLSVSWLRSHTWHRCCWRSPTSSVFLCTGQFLSVKAFLLRIFRIWREVFWGIHRHRDLSWEIGHPLFPQSHPSVFHFGTLVHCADKAFPGLETTPCWYMAI